MKQKYSFARREILFIYEDLKSKFKHLNINPRSFSFYD
jgi:hypothetical protein